MVLRRWPVRTIVRAVGAGGLLAVPMTAGAAAGWASVLGSAGDGACQAIGAVAAGAALDGLPRVMAVVGLLGAAALGASFLLPKRSAGTPLAPPQAPPPSPPTSPPTLAGSSH
jgi:hypothetical protein